MLYQLSYALEPHFQVSTLGGVILPASHAHPRRCKEWRLSNLQEESSDERLTRKCHVGRIDLQLGCR